MSLKDTMRKSGEGVCTVIAGLLFLIFAFGGIGLSFWVCAKIGKLIFGGE